MEKATIGARFLALLIDSFCISLLCSPLSMVSMQLYALTSSFAVFFYYALCEGSSGSATIGKRCMGLKVVDMQGQPLTMSKSFVRAIGRLLSGAIVCIGFFMAFSDPNGRTLHDKMADTMVVRAASAPYVAPTPVAPTPIVQGTPWVIGIQGQFAGQSFPVSAQGILIGRDATVCNIVFHSSAPGLSRNHCKLQFTPQTNMFVLYDLGSSYGTFTANGGRISQGQPVALHNGDSFYLGVPENLFQVAL